MAPWKKFQIQTEHIYGMGIHKNRFCCHNEGY